MEISGTSAGTTRGANGAASRVTDGLLNASAAIEGPEANGAAALELGATLEMFLWKIRGIEAA